jgi:hypothetical protein
MGPHADEHPKHAHYPTGNPHFLPLSIDVKKVGSRNFACLDSTFSLQEQTLYQPKTEVISPIHDEPKVDGHMRDVTVIRSSIGKLNSDIDVTTKKLHRAKLNQVREKHSHADRTELPIFQNEIKRQADRTAVDDEEHEEIIQTNGSQTLIEKILHDNRVC